MKHAGDEPGTRIHRVKRMDLIEHCEGIRLVILFLPIHGGDREIDPGINAIGVSVDYRLENPHGVLVVVTGEKTGGLSMRAVEILGALSGGRAITTAAEAHESHESHESQPEYQHSDG